MRDDQRQRIFMFRTDMDEMNVEPIDLGNVLRQGVEFRFDFAPVIFGLPIARERFTRRELDALRLVRNGFAIRPAGRSDAFAQIDQGFFGNADTERGDVPVFVEILEAVAAG